MNTLEDSFRHDNGTLILTRAQNSCYGSGSVLTRRISMRWLHCVKARCFRLRSRGFGKFGVFSRSKIVELPFPIPRRSPEEIAAVIEKAYNAFKVHEYRMQVDPIYRKQKRIEERKFNRYMFFHDFWTFKRYLGAPARFLWRRWRCRIKKK